MQRLETSRYERKVRPGPCGCNRGLIRWVLPPYLTLSIDADVQRVGLTSGAVYDGGRALGVEVVALSQAVQRTRLNATWFTQRRSTSLSGVQPARRKTDNMTWTLPQEINDKQHMETSRARCCPPDPGPALGSPLRLLTITTMWSESQRRSDLRPRAWRHCNTDTSRDVSPCQQQLHWRRLSAVHGGLRPAERRESGGDGLDQTDPCDKRHPTPALPSLKENKSRVYMLRTFITFSCVFS